MYNHPVRRALLGLVLATVSVSAWLVLESCSEPPETRYGNPGALDRGKIPGDGGVEQLICDGGGGAREGGEGGCPSFDADIFPNMLPNGKWRCTDPTCHGGASSPTIASTSPQACLASLREIQLLALPYVPADGGRDPNASRLLCNLQGSCGSKMPEPPGADLSVDELCMLQAWLQCGAPGN